MHTHIEPLARTDWASAPDTDETAVEREAIESAVRRFTGSSPLAVSFRDGEQGRVALVTVSLPGDQPLPVGPPARRARSRRRCASAARAWRT